MPNFRITYFTTLPFSDLVSTRLSPEKLESLFQLLCLKSLPQPTTSQNSPIRFMGVNFVKAYSEASNDTGGRYALRVLVQIEVKANAHRNLYNMPIPTNFLEAAVEELKAEIGPVYHLSAEWHKIIPYAVPGKHVLTIKEKPSPHIFESKSRYHVLVNDEFQEELYFNMKGYVGSLPLLCGNSLSIGEKGISAFKREASIINREEREVLEFYNRVIAQGVGNKAANKLVKAPHYFGFICPCCGRVSDADEESLEEGMACPAIDCDSNDMHKITFTVNGEPHSDIMSKLPVEAEIALFKGRYDLLSSCYRIGANVDDISVI